MSKATEQQVKGNGHGSKRLFGYLVEFANVDDLVRAARKVRDAGFRDWDCHTPFPVHGLDRHMGIKYTKLPLFILACGLTGLVGAILLQWWMNAVDYPYLISGKPIWSIPANIPIIFELTVLFSAIGSLVGLLAFNKLPEWNHPTLASERFRRATNDRFFISIEARDPQFHPERTRSFCQSLGGDLVEELEA